MSKNHLVKAALADLCTLVTDGTHDTPKRVQRGIPLIKAKEIVGGKIDFENCDQISYEDHLRVIARSNPEKGDTLFAHIGASLGEAAYVSVGDSFSIKNIALFKPDPSKIDGRYLYYLVISPEFQGLAKAARTGSAQPFLSLGHLRAHPVRYHEDIDEQKRISSILGAYDDLIEVNRQRIAVLEEMARRLFDEWFVRFRFPGYEKTVMVEAGSDLVPSDWGIKTIGGTFHTVLGGTPSRKKSDYWQSGDVPWINSGKANELRIANPSEQITKDALEKSAAKMMPAGAVVVAITGATLGQHSVLLKPMCGNQSLVGIWDESEKRREHLYRYIATNMKRLVQHASGGAQQHINKEIVDRFSYLDPPEDLLAQYNKLALPLADLIGNLIVANDKLKLSRDMLLPRLTTGELSIAKAERELEAVA